MSHRPSEFPCLPAAPLAAVVTRAGIRSIFRNPYDDLPVHRNEPSGQESICLRAGIHPRDIYRWRQPGAKVTFEVADRVITGIGLLWFDVWTLEDDPAVYAKAKRAWEGPEEALAA